MEYHSWCAWTTARESFLQCHDPTNAIESKNEGDKGSNSSDRSSQCTKQIRNVAVMMQGDDPMMNEDSGVIAESHNNSLAQDGTEYFSFEYHERPLTVIQVLGWMIPIAICFSVGLILCLLAFVPFIASMVALGMVFLFTSLAVFTSDSFCGGIPHFRESPKAQIFAKAQLAREEIKKRSTLRNADSSCEDRDTTNEQNVPDWSELSGIYASPIQPEAGQIHLRFKRYKPWFHKRSDLQPLCWMVEGKAQDNSFRILHGLLSYDGQLYWLERHCYASGRFMKDSDEGYRRWAGGPRRYALVKASLDFHSRRLNGAYWCDNFKCSGKYLPITWQQENSILSSRHDPVLRDYREPPPV